VCGGCADVLVCVQPNGPDSASKMPSAYVTGASRASA
jgi:hypothetical protein